MRRERGQQQQQQQQQQQAASEDVAPLIDGAPTPFSSKPKPFSFTMMVRRFFMKKSNAATVSIVAILLLSAVLHHHKHAVSKKNGVCQEEKTPLINNLETVCGREVKNVGGPESEDLFGLFHDKPYFYQGWSDATDPSFRIHLHNRDVSATPSFIRKGCYECHVYVPMMQALASQKQKQLLLLDVGANLGQFALGAVALGHYAIALEPFRKNWLPLCFSVVANPGFSQRMQVYPIAATSNKRHKVARIQLIKGVHENPASVSIRHESTKQTMQRTKRWDNIGQEEEEEREEELLGRDYSYGVALDDLYSHFRLPKTDLFLKIDVEGHECRVLEGAQEYLQRVRIHYVALRITHAQLDGSCWSVLQRVLVQHHALQPYAYDPEDNWVRLPTDTPDKWMHPDKNLANRTHTSFETAWTTNGPPLWIPLDEPPDTRVQSTT